MKKKVFLLFTLALAALLCFAVPAIAGPPEAMPTLAAASLDAGNALGVYVQEAAIVAAPVSSIESRAVNFDAFAALGFALVLIAIAAAATLAYLMHGNASQVMRERNGRGIANGYRGGRRWV